MTRFYGLGIVVQSGLDSHFGPSAPVGVRLFVDAENPRMFIGEYQHTMDQKGRVSLPSRFREELVSRCEGSESAADRVILTKKFEGCLVLYSMDEWSIFEKKVAELPQFDPWVQKLKRVYVAGSIEVQIDKNGRLLVPQSLRSFAKLDRDVVWVGQLATAELWEASLWQDALEDATQDPKGLADAMAKFGL